MKHFFPELKKGFHQEWNAFFPRIQVQTCAQMHTRVKLLEGMQVKTILKVLGGIHSKYLGGYIPLPPSFGTTVCHVVLFFSSWDPQWNKILFSQQAKKFVLCGNRKIYPSSKRPVIRLAFCKKILVNFFLCYL